MRIIFLDVDGVLNNNYTTDRYNGFIGIDQKLVDRLKILYDKSNEEEETRIVVSSSWRYDKIRKDYISDGCYDYLKKRLGDMEVIGETPDLKRGWSRASEVKAWLEKFREKFNVKSFVILDDEQFDFAEQGLSKYTILTNFRIGLTQADAENALLILQGKEKKKLWADLIDVEDDPKGNIVLPWPEDRESNQVLDYGSEDEE